MKLRLDKFLCDMGCGTRSEIKNACKAGLIMVNDTIAKNPALKVELHKDNVFFRGEEIVYSEYEYFILNKPQGVISASEDPKTKTVVDLITTSKRKDLFPVGRLDKDTEGLLIITNDGMLAHDLLSPKKHVNKTYLVHTDHALTESHVKMVSEGIQIEEDFITKPGTLEILSSSEDWSIAKITISEGKFHQIKRMMERMDNTVTFLKRIRMGPIELPLDLDTGSYRPLTLAEIKLLKSFTNKEP